MRTADHLPDIIIVSVLSEGGPYAVGDLVSVAFTTPDVGRLAAHVPKRELPQTQRGETPVPESISVKVTHDAGPYAIGEWLTLSFVDPHVARIHPSGHVRLAANDVIHSRAQEHHRIPQDTPTPAQIVEIQAQTDLSDRFDERHVPADRFRKREGSNDEARCESDDPKGGVRVELAWSAERTQRFVRVVDKLFTVDRLGWYRHVLAVRLLVPDEIVTGDGPADLDVARQLNTLRGAVTQALGRPLLAACMPNFCVTPEWLDELDSPGAARAIGGLREALMPYVDDSASIGSHRLDANRTIGIVTRSELLASPSTSVEALLPVLIPYFSPMPAVTNTLFDYRCALLELFRQTAGSADAVRLNAMSQPNHALDDRLWQLAGAVGESFGVFGPT